MPNEVVAVGIPDLKRTFSKLRRGKKIELLLPLFDTLIDEFLDSAKEAFDQGKPAWGITGISKESGRNHWFHIKGEFAKFCVPDEKRRPHPFLLPYSVTIEKSGRKFLQAAFRAYIQDQNLERLITTTKARLTLRFKRMNKDLRRFYGIENQNGAPS